MWPAEYHEAKARGMAKLSSLRQEVLESDRAIGARNPRRLFGLEEMATLTEESWPSENPR